MKQSEVLFPDIFLFLEIDFKKIARKDFLVSRRIYFHFSEFQKKNREIKEYDPCGSRDK